MRMLGAHLNAGSDRLNDTIRVFLNQLKPRPLDRFFVTVPPPQPFSGGVIFSTARSAHNFFFGGSIPISGYLFVI